MMAGAYILSVQLWKGGAIKYVAKLDGQERDYNSRVNLITKVLDFVQLGGAPAHRPILWDP